MNPCLRPHKLLEETGAGAQGLVCPPVLQRVPGPFPTQRMDAEVGAGSATQQVVLTGAWPGQLLGNLAGFRTRHLFPYGWQGSQAGAPLLPDA